MGAVAAAVEGEANAGAETAICFCALNELALRGLEALLDEILQRAFTDGSAIKQSALALTFQASHTKPRRAVASAEHLQGPPIFEDTQASSLTSLT